MERDQKKIMSGLHDVLHEARNGNNRENGDSIFTEWKSPDYERKMEEARQKEKSKLEKETSIISSLGAGVRK